MEDEVRQSIYIAIGLIVLAVVLTFFSYTMGLERKMANVRNNEITTQQTTAQFREYNAYNGQNLIGDDVIEVIRLKYDTGIDMFVGYRKNVKTNEVVNSANKFGSNNTYKMNGCDARIFNADNFVTCQQGAQFGYSSYFAINQNSKDADNNDMRNWFPTTARYRTYLVYDNYSVESFYMDLYNYYNKNVVTSWDLDKQLETLDGYGMTQKKSGSEVTGIVFLYLTDTGIIW